MVEILSDAKYNPNICQQSSKCQKADTMCIPMINSDENECAEKTKDIVKLQIKKPTSSPDMEELKAQVYDAITNMVKSAGRKTVRRRRKRAGANDVEVYIIDVTERADGYVDVEFVVMDTTTTEGVYSKEEVMNMLNTRCREIGMVVMETK